MNEGGGFGPVKGLGYAMKLGWFTFAPNGASNPTSITGPLARFVTSITYSATGVQTIVFNSGFVFAQTPRFRPTAELESLTEHFNVNQTGAYDTTTRTLVLTTHRNGTGREVAANAAAAITVYVFASDTTGK